MFKYLLFYNFNLQWLQFILYKKNTGKDKNTWKKKHISLISFLTIFNNIKGRKNKKDKNIGLI